MRFAMQKPPFPTIVVNLQHPDPLDSSKGQREAKKPDVMMRLTKVYAQYKTLDARQAAVRAEQNSVGNVVIESVAGSASGFLNNRMALDNAARSAFARWR